MTLHISQVTLLSPQSTNGLMFRIKLAILDETLVHLICRLCSPRLMPPKGAETINVPLSSFDKSLLIVTQEKLAKRSRDKCCPGLFRERDRDMAIYCQQPLIGHYGALAVCCGKLRRAGLLSEPEYLFSREEQSNRIWLTWALGR